MSVELLGLCRDFVFAGQIYKVAPRDLFIECQFALWVTADAAQDLERLRMRVPTAFFAEQMRIFNDKITGKKFKWGSEDVYTASCSEVGQRELLWLKMKRGEAKGGAFIPREMLDTIAADASAYKDLLDILYRQDYPDFFDKHVQGEETAPSTTAAMSPDMAAPTPVTA